ncbi:MAG: hypothetical protein OMM_06433 [Candidatus Magnetoglobus multicellularis str. Araruama]|uniref:Uncharacterized protein n=1 Tax=Candidatus Magnetoglobus multicellularis str. Araruama TaxID=890399 RepID=A0A1V1PHU2_9BACT|nr:MAG: hypothetical protein OMM_06433 [Candidatus Magnetoglobus multicellularis str. Araruama]
MTFKTKLIVGTSTLFILGISTWIAWNFMIPSQDIKKRFKDMQADASGLERKITHTLFDGSKKEWKCRAKVYPFPSDTGAGAAFSFIDVNGKKIICGPGWRIEEE